MTMSYNVALGPMRAFITELSELSLVGRWEMYDAPRTCHALWTHGSRVRLLGGLRGPPEAPCAAQQCGNGAPALRVAQSTDFPI